MGNRYQSILDSLTEDGYTKSQLLDIIERFYPKYDINARLWVLGEMIKDSKYVSIGYDCFSLKGNGFSLGVPKSSQAATALQSLKSVDPNAAYVFYSTRDLGGLLDVGVYYELDVLEVDKKLLYPVYLAFKAQARKRVLLNPTKKEFSMYFDEGALLIKPYKSKAPLFKDGAYRLEKLCVDLLLDWQMDEFFALPELDVIAGTLVSGYDMNIKTLLSYAERRNVYERVLNIVENNLQTERIALLKSTLKFPKY